MNRYCLGYEKDEFLGLTLHFLTTSDEKPQPAIIFLHGFTGSKEHHLPLRMALADLGYLVVSFDAREHGDRLALPELWSHCRENFLNTFLTVLMDTVDDTVAVYRHLQAKRTLEQGRIGLVGGSMGGMIGLMSIPKLPGLRAAVIMAGSTDLLKWKDETHGHELYQFPRKEASPEVVNRLQSYEAGNRLGSFYPVRLLMVHGDQDDIVPPRGPQELYERLQPYYHQNPSFLKFSLYPELAHDTSPALLSEAYSWLQSHL